MADISVRGFDGDSGGPVGGGMNIVHPQPDFASMTLEQIQAWEAANNTNPLTGTLPASAVIPAHATEESAAAAAAEEAQQAQVLSLVPASAEEAAYQADTGPEQAEFVRAEFSLGEPFIHLVALLTQGPVEIVATPAEALELYNKLGLALGAAQRAGVIA